MNILALFQPIQNSVSQTTLQQMSRIMVVMIAMTGRVTRLGLSRWMEKEGDCRTTQRFFLTYMALDGHISKNPAFYMARQCQ